MKLTPLYFLFFPLVPLYLLLTWSLPMFGRLVTVGTDTLTPADCGQTVQYQSSVQINVAAPNLPAGCWVTIVNTGTARAWITVTEPGMATAQFGAPPTHKWLLHTDHAGDGSWFAALKSND